jgi:hypothetical protein
VVLPTPIEAVVGVTVTPVTAIVLIPTVTTKVLILWHPFAFV